MNSLTQAHPGTTWMLVGCGTWLIALGLCFAGFGALIRATNLALHFDFRWLLPTTFVVWLAGLAGHVASP